MFCRISVSDVKMFRCPSFTSYEMRGKFFSIASKKKKTLTGFSRRQKAGVLRTGMNEKSHKVKFYLTDKRFNVPMHRNCWLFDDNTKRRRFFVRIALSTSLGSVPKIFIVIKFKSMMYLDVILMLLIATL